MQRDVKQRSQRRAVESARINPNVKASSGIFVGRYVSNEGRGLSEAFSHLERAAQEKNRIAEAAENKEALTAANKGDDFDATYRSAQTAYEQTKTAVEVNRGIQDWYAYREDNSSSFEGKPATEEAKAFEEFMAERFGDLDTPDTQYVFAEMMQKATEKVYGEGLKRNADETFRDRINTAFDFLVQKLQDKNVKPGELFKDLGSDAFTSLDESGKFNKLTSEQREALVVEAVTSEAVSQMRPEMLSFLFEKQPNGSPALANHPKYKAQIAKAKIEADRHRMMDYQVTIDRLADKGDFTLAMGHQAIEEGVPYQFVVSQLMRNLSGNSERLHTDYILGLLKEGRAMEHVKPKDVQKVIDGNYDVAFRSRDDGQMLAVVRESVHNGFVPTQVKQLLSTITPNSNPEAVERARTFYNQINQYDNKLALSRLQDKTVATFDFLNTAIEVAGLPPEAALKNLDNRDEKLARFTISSEKGRQALDSALSDVKDYPWTIDDIEDNPLLTKTLNDLVKVAVGGGYSDIDEATAWAVKRLHETNEEVNGRLIPKAAFPGMKNIEDNLIQFATDELNLDVDDYDIRIPANFREKGVIEIMPKGTLFPTSEHLHNISDVNTWYAKTSSSEQDALRREERAQYLDERKEEARELFLDDKHGIFSWFKADEFDALPEEEKQQWIEKAIDEYNAKATRRAGEKEQFYERVRNTDFKSPVFTTKT